MPGTAAPHSWSGGWSPDPQVLQSLPLQQACHQERVKPMQHAITACRTETRRLHMWHVAASVEAKRVQRQEW